MTDWQKTNDITGIGPASESEMLKLIWWLKQAVIDIQLLKAGSANAVHVHNAGDLGTIDKAEAEWRNSAVIVVDAAVFKSGLLTSLFEFLDPSENPIYLGVISHDHLSVEDAVFSSGKLRPAHLSYLSTLKREAGEDKLVEIQIFKIEPSELPETKPSLRDQFGKRPVTETMDNLGGRERWYKNRHDKN